jgi:hypothetical protein
MATSAPSRAKACLDAIHAGDRCVAGNGIRQRSWCYGVQTIDATTSKIIEASLVSRLIFIQKEQENDNSRQGQGGGNADGK